MIYNGSLRYIQENLKKFYLKSMEMITIEYGNELEHFTEVNILFEKRKLLLFIVTHFELAYQWKTCLKVQHTKAKLSGN